MSDTITKTLPAASIVFAAAAPPIESHGAASARIQRDAFINIVPIEKEQPKAAELEKLANVMIEPPQDPPAETQFDNRAMPAAYTYFSQFVDHDLTGQNQNALIARPAFNKRSAGLDLDSIYGSDTIDSLVGDLLIAVDPAYQTIYDDDGIRFRLEKTKTGNHDDLPRTLDRGDRTDPIVPDARNDENLIVSQIDLAFLKFHNAVVDELSLRTELVGNELFSAAYSVVVQHYQWIVLNDFLPRLVSGHDIAGGRAYIAHVRKSRDRKYTKADVSRGMPAEFSVAAYRMGHSMVRFNYALNGETLSNGKPEREIFETKDTENDLHGHREYPANAIIEWHRFLDFAKDAPQDGDPQFEDPQFSMLLDTGLSNGLSMLPNFSFQDAKDPEPPKIEHILAYRNLVKGTIFQLPSGQDVAAFYGFEPRSITVLGKTTVPEKTDEMPDPDFRYGSIDQELTDRFGDDTPLWYYILKEAQDLAKGAHLGPLGARIVTECFLAFLAASPISIFDTGFAPTAGEFGCVEDNEYNLARLIRYATKQ
ncbi:MAG: heme peroxidase family protein [Vulcanimicrobiaceae bacterium]